MLQFCIERLALPLPITPTIEYAIVAFSGLCDDVENNVTSASCPAAMFPYAISFLRVIDVLEKSVAGFGYLSSPPPAVTKTAPALKLALLYATTLFLKLIIVVPLVLAWKPIAGNRVALLLETMLFVRVAFIRLWLPHA